MLKEELYSEVLNKKINENWAYTEIMRAYNCTYPEIKNLVEAYKEQQQNKNNNEERI